MFVVFRLVDVKWTLLWVLRGVEQGWGDLGATLAVMCVCMISVRSPRCVGRTVNGLQLRWPRVCLDDSSLAVFVTNNV